jgi:hypothetical protein
MRFRLAQFFVFFAAVAIQPSSAGIDPQTPRDPMAYDLGDAPSSIAIVDLNGDHKPEIVVINRHTNTVAVLLNKGNGTFLAKSRHTTGVAPSALAFGDFNKDRKPDIVVANSLNNSVSVFLGTGDGTLGKRADYLVGPVPCALLVADLNRDGMPDLLVANRFGGSVSVLLGKGNGTFGSKTDYSTGSLPYSVAVSDVNFDGKPDLLATSCFDHNVSMLAGKGDGTFLSKVRYAKAKRSCGVVMGDIDGDGRPDLVEPHRYGYLVSVQFGRDSGAELRNDYLSGKGPRAIKGADFNGDGVTDMAVANSGHSAGEAGSVFVFLGRRSGGFEAKSSYATGNASYSLEAGDLNGDGKLDLAVLNSSHDFGGSVSVLLGNGDGTFGARADYATGGYLIWISFGEDAKKE